MADDRESGRAGMAVYSSVPALDTLVFHNPLVTVYKPGYCIKMALEFAVSCEHAMIQTFEYPAVICSKLTMFTVFTMDCYIWSYPVPWSTFLHTLVFLEGKLCVSSLIS